MKKLLIFCQLFFYINFCLASDRMHEFVMRLASEQIDFVSDDLHDVARVQKVLSMMYELDQEVRQIFIQDRHNCDLQNLMISMDHFHTQMMKAILVIHGWPKISKFGQFADHQAWLLLQHADHDLPFQEQCLYLLQKFN